MTVADITSLVTALTALAVAVGGVLTALKVLREVKTGNELTQTGNKMTGGLHKRLKKMEENSNAVPEEEKR